MQPTDLDRAYSALTAKKPRIDLWWRYYDGDHILPFISERLREVFRNLSPDFNLNWCEAVIDATADRISLTGLTATDERGTGALKEELPNLKSSTKSTGPRLAPCSIWRKSIRPLRICWLRIA